MSRTWDGIRTYHPNAGRALYPLELRRTHGEQCYILGIYFARISIILVLFGVRFRHYW